MSYITNPHMPRVRRDAVRLHRAGWSVRRVARHLGFTHSAIVKWTARASLDGRLVIPTRSSRPFHHPRELKPEIIRLIIDYRRRSRRCAEVIHHFLVRDGVSVSLSSVKRTLRRNHLTYPSLWKKWHQYPPRPLPERPGLLVEIDTIVDGAPEDRLYVYTLIDVYSRWAYAMAALRATNHMSLRFIGRARERIPFLVRTLQSDHGSEFSKWFTKQLLTRGIAHRHSRVRTPSDNGHLERFNRTLQNECLNRVPRKIQLYRKEIPEYLRHYNTERPHMALKMKTPMDIIKAVPSY